MHTIPLFALKVKQLELICTLRKFTYQSVCLYLALQPCEKCVTRTRCAHQRAYIIQMHTLSEWAYKWKIPYFPRQPSQCRWIIKSWLVCTGFFWNLIHCSRIRAVPQSHHIISFDRILIACIRMRIFNSEMQTRQSLAAAVVPQSGCLQKAAQKIASPPVRR